MYSQLMVFIVPEVTEDRALNISGTEYYQCMQLADGVQYRSLLCTPLPNCKFCDYVGRGGVDSYLLLSDYLRQICEFSVLALIYTLALEDTKLRILLS